MLHQKEKESWLMLYHTTGLSGRRMKRLLDKLGEPAEILAMSTVQLMNAGVDPDLAEQINAARRNCTTLQRTQAALEWCSEDWNHLITCRDTEFPPLLSEVEDAPPLLFAQGDPAVLLSPMVAIVGSRNSSHYGRHMATQLSTGLARAGFTIASGLASGIDTIAHRAALKARKPTIAVLGSGLRQIYPASNSGLAEQISHGDVPGIVISEFPLDDPPQAFHFPQRNRIISGMSLGVCVVEATLRSGSLITARLGLEQNRNVFAVPGSVNNPGSRGCHRLLREGAMLAENAADILEQLEPLIRGQLALLQEHGSCPDNAQMMEQAVPANCAGLLKLITDDPVTQDNLLQRSGLSVAELSAQLLALELSGKICKVAGKWLLTY